MLPINSVVRLIKFTSRWRIKLLRLAWDCSACGEDVGDRCGCMTFSKPVSSLENITGWCRSCGWTTAGSSDISGWIGTSLTTCCQKWGRELRGRTPVIGAQLSRLSASQFVYGEFMIYFFLYEFTLCFVIYGLEIRFIVCYMDIYQFVI